LSDEKLLLHVSVLVLTVIHVMFTQEHVEAAVRCNVAVDEPVVLDMAASAVDVPAKLDAFVTVNVCAAVKFVDIRVFCADPRYVRPATVAPV
jgi:hypothetical protein